MLQLLLWVPHFENHCITTRCPLEGMSSLSLQVFKQRLNDFWSQQWLKGRFNQTLYNVPCHEEAPRVWALDGKGAQGHIGMGGLAQPIS